MDYTQQTVRRSFSYPGGVGGDVMAKYGYLVLSNHIVALYKQDPMLRHFCPIQYTVECNNINTIINSDLS